MADGKDVKEDVKLKKGQGRYVNKTKQTIKAGTEVSVKVARGGVEPLEVPAVVVSDIKPGEAGAAKITEQESEGKAKK